uniref:T-cell-specific surface glycoprotein CD28-like n=1 Tax=Paramormyrops kingsleyae TaxID=1676925 RepID=A0A3B3S3D6_9TELE
MNLRLVALLSLCVSALRALKVYQPYRIHGRDGQLQLNCSYRLHARVEEVHVTLYRGMHGDQRVCSSTLNHTASWQPLQAQQQGLIHCMAELRPSGVVLLISGLQVEDTDFYRCMVEVLYPPPYQKGTGNGTLLHIQETPSCPEPEPQTEESTEDPTVLIPAAMIAVITVCIVIIVAVIVKVSPAGCAPSLQERAPAARPVSRSASPLRCFC